MGVQELVHARELLAVWTTIEFSVYSIYIPPVDATTWNEVWPTFCTTNDPPCCVVPVQFPNPLSNWISKISVVDAVLLFTKNAGDVVPVEQMATDTVSCWACGRENVGSLDREAPEKEYKVLRVSDSCALTWASVACIRYQRNRESVCIDEARRCRGQLLPVRAVGLGNRYRCRVCWSGCLVAAHDGYY